MLIFFILLIIRLPDHILDALPRAKPGRDLRLCLDPSNVRSSEMQKNSTALKARVNSRPNQASLCLNGALGP